MDESRKDNRTTGGPLDIEEDDLYRNETDQELRKPGEDAEIDPDERPNLQAVRAGLKYGRDSYVVKSDVDPEEDNYAPGVREQD